jgi:hypothetical protein
MFASLNFIGNSSTSSTNSVSTKPAQRPSSLKSAGKLIILNKAPSPDANSLFPPAFCTSISSKQNALNSTKKLPNGPISSASVNSKRSSGSKNSLYELFDPDSRSPPPSHGKIKPRESSATKSRGKLPHSRAPSLSSVPNASNLSHSTSNSSKKASPGPAVASIALHKVSDPYNCQANAQSLISTERSRLGEKSPNFSTSKPRLVAYNSSSLGSYSSENSTFISPVLGTVPISSFGASRPIVLSNEFNWEQYYEELLTNDSLKIINSPPIGSIENIIKTGPNSRRNSAKNNKGGSQAQGQGLGNNSHINHSNHNGASAAVAPASEEQIKAALSNIHGLHKDSASNNKQHNQKENLNLRTLSTPSASSTTLHSLTASVSSLRVDPEAPLLADSSAEPYVEELLRKVSDYKHQRISSCPELFATQDKLICPVKAVKSAIKNYNSHKEISPRVSLPLRYDIDNQSDEVFYGQVDYWGAMEEKPSCPFQQQLQAAKHKKNKHSITTQTLIKQELKELQKVAAANTTADNATTTNHQHINNVDSSKKTTHQV